jgi:hypothetical protein
VKKLINNMSILEEIISEMLIFINTDHHFERGCTQWLWARRRWLHKYKNSMVRLVKGLKTNKSKVITHTRLTTGNSNERPAHDKNLDESAAVIRNTVLKPNGIGVFSSKSQRRTLFMAF